MLTVTVNAVAELTVTADTGMLAPPDAVSVTVGEPAASKFVPVMLRLVVPAAYTVELTVTVGMGRIVPATTALPLDKPYMVTTANSVWPASPAARAGTVHVS